MAEYIDRQEAKKFIDDCLLREDKLQSVEKETLLSVKRWIDAIPPADVWPVVRCKNCKYSREPDRHNVADMLICFVDEQVYPPSKNDVFVGREFFCGFGQARND